MTPYAFRICISLPRFDFWSNIESRINSMIDWCDYQVGQLGIDYDYTASAYLREVWFSFKRESDAVMFKMKFG